MLDKATELLQEMAGELPSLVAIAAVHLEDGLSIAEVSKKDNVEAGAVSAYMAAIVQANLQAIRTLGDHLITDDILITTNQYYFLIRNCADRPYFLFAMTEKDAWLGKARLVLQKYVQRLQELLD